MLFLPPFGDYEGSREAFKSIEDPSLLGEAAIWLAYHYYTLFPEDEGFVQTLENHAGNAAACYSLARYNAHIGQEASAQEWNQRSIQLERFPNNLIFDLLHNPQDQGPEKAGIAKELEKLIVEKVAEETTPSTAADLYKNYWDELILGGRMTSVVWQHLQKQLKQLTECPSDPDAAE